MAAASFTNVFPLTEKGRAASPESITPGAAIPPTSAVVALVPVAAFVALDEAAEETGLADALEPALLETLVVAELACSEVLDAFAPAFPALLVAALACSEVLDAFPPVTFDALALLITLDEDEEAAAFPPVAFVADALLGTLDEDADALPPVTAFPPVVAPVVAPVAPPAVAPAAPTVNLVQSSGVPR